MTQLRLAIPSKGRLKEASEAWLKASGFQLTQMGGGRGYSAELKGLPDTKVMLLSAREIAEGLIAGDLHVGITGEDLVHDLSANVSRDVDVLVRLGFGGADVVVAVPQSWLDVETLADLDAAGAQFRTRHGRRMRVATKYLRLARRFFSERAVGEYRLIESAGATEAAPAAGSAELIVDITSTGATLKANGLKVLRDGVILQSEAALVASRKVDWSDEALCALNVLLDGAAANAQAQSNVRLETAQPLPKELAGELGLSLLSSGGILCLASQANSVARTLAQRGYGPVVIGKVGHIYQAKAPVFERFVKNLSQSA